MVVALIGGILTQPGDFEVLVHVDGSDDGTVEALGGIVDQRLRITAGPNAGRAMAMTRMVRNARGQFVMIYDDDDKLDAAGLALILSDCGLPLDDRCCGYIYHYRTPDGGRQGPAFGTPRSNFLKLRADQGVTGDKREVVRGDLLKAALEPRAEEFRRIPTSLYWARIALTHDVICRELTIGEHTYQAGGMTANISKMKHRDPWPIYLTHLLRLRGWFWGRYRSPRFALRSAVAAAHYGWRALAARVARP